MPDSENPKTTSREDPSKKVIHTTKGGNTLTQGEWDMMKKRGSQWNSEKDWGDWVDRSMKPVDSTKYQNTNATRMYVEDPKPTKNNTTRFYETKGGVEKDISREQFEAGRANPKRSYDGEPVIEREVDKKKYLNVGVLPPKIK